MKKALCFFQPQEIAYLRVFTAGIFLLPYSLPQLSKINLFQYKLLTLVGVVGTLLPLLCFAKAQLHINSGVHGVLNSLTPVFVLMVALIFFKKKILKNEILGVLLGILGTTLLMIIESRSFEGSFNYYILLSLLGSCLYGNTTNLIKYYLGNLKSTTIVSVSLLIIGIVGGIYLLIHPEIFIKIKNTSNEGYRPAVYILIAGIVNLGIANIILTELVKITSPVFTSTESLLAPIVSLSWGIIDGEKLVWEHYLGAAIILIGVYFINKPTKKEITEG